MREEDGGCGWGGGGGGGGCKGNNQIFATIAGYIGVWAEKSAKLKIYGCTSGGVSVPCIYRHAR